jgi:ribosomal protein S18 acetylase RimI-like enzyme
MPDSSPLTLRDLLPSDVDTLVEIAVAAWEPIYAHFRETMGDDLFLSLYPDWPARKGGQIRSACDPASPRPMQVLVAEEGGRIVGFVTFHTDPATRVGEIGNNAVRPECRGRGIAQRLYEAALERMRAQGMRYAKVQTGLDPSHAPARRAYEKAGFDIALPAVEYYRKL